MWLPWYYGLALAVLFAGGAAIAARRNDRWAEAVQPFLSEASIVAGLYAVWQLAGRVSLLQIDDAFRRGEGLYDFQQWLLVIPDERAWQQAILGYPKLVQASNLYYGGMHVPAMGIFLVWLFVRHRGAYPPWRNALAWLTGLCLVIQLLPVAPPRLIDSLDIVDTPAAYGQSVYSALGYRVAGQLQAMPSIHVAWAVLIAVAVWRLTSGWGRWVAVGHAAATAYVVVVTGNHFWMDGIVAVALLVVIRLVQRGLADRRAAPGRTAVVATPHEVTVG